jgi:hypothetical protein
MRNVSVSLNADNQITVTLGTESRAGESYYLGLEPNSANHSFRPATGIMQLLTEWIRLISELKCGQQLFLPFDFSDEYTRWLNLHRDGRNLIVVFGWATIEGWAISPKDLSQYAHGLPGFMPDEPLISQTLYLPRVLNELRLSREQLSAQAEKEMWHLHPEDRLTS